MADQFPPDKVLRVVLQAQEWGIVLAGLHELPAKHSFNLIVRLQEQFAAQAPRELPAENGVEAERTV